MGIDSIEEPFPLPPLLYVIYGADQQVYYFDTSWGRARAYLDLVEKRTQGMDFFMISVKDRHRIASLW